MKNQESQQCNLVQFQRPENQWCKFKSERLRTTGELMTKSWSEFEGPRTRNTDVSGQRKMIVLAQAERKILPFF